MKKTSNDDPYSQEDKLAPLTADYEKTQGIIEMIITRHRYLKEEHEKIFHDMMGH